ncbi:MAG TPA: metallophosphoesterase [Stellaceae bacterium]|jgi:3',5'-cyclic AMP phosphodiesterase CpdA
MRIIQITDTHLSANKAHFAGNWPPLARWIESEQPDLVIHSGDVTVDGAGLDDDMAHAARLLGDLPVPVRAIPGNHDVGDALHHRQPIDKARLARWRAHFGPDRWIEDIAGWRLIGFNALLFGSGLAEEAAQADWIEAVTTGAAGRRVAWFLHKPLFLDSPEEGDSGYWSVKPEPRARLMALLRRHRVALVASGHLHKARDLDRDGTRYLWAPASSFLVGEMQPAMPGEKRLGGVRYELDADGLAAEIVAVPGLVEHWLDPVIQEVYPRRPEPAAGS